MGLALNWREEDKIRFGNCSDDRQAVVHAFFSNSSGHKNGSIADSPERNSRYILYNPNMWPVNKLDIPEGKKGYALEYTEMPMPLSREDVAVRLRKALGEQFPKNMPDREKLIESRVQHYLSDHPVEGLFSGIGHTFGHGMEAKDGMVWAPVKKFVRWVSKEEFDEKAQEAKKIHETEGDDGNAWFMSRWYKLRYEERQEKCKTCPLCTTVRPFENPYVNKLKKQLKKRNKNDRFRLLQGIYKQLVESKKGNIAKGEYRNLVESKSEHLPDLIGFVAEQLVNVGHEQLGAKLSWEYDFPGRTTFDCHAESSYSHWGAFFEYISKFSKLRALDKAFKACEGEISAKELASIEENLKRSRVILDSKEASGINMYNKKGRLIGTHAFSTGNLSGNDIYGYAIGIEGKEDAITVTFKAPSLYDIPQPVRKKLLDEQGLEGIMLAIKELDKLKERFYFTEVFREGKTFYGKTRGGCLVELPPIKDLTLENVVHTPFGSERKGEKNKVARMEYTTVSPHNGFGYLQNLLEKYVELAKIFSMPIQKG